MADIAMLVAEEYERRIKLARKNNKVIDEGGEVSSTADMSSSSSGPLYGFKIKWMNQASVHFTGVDPVSQVGRAALDGFFSA
ncbi:hypothetical protein vseg_015624 [Gypsophila vaccaria]